MKRLINSVVVVMIATIISCATGENPKIQIQNPNDQMERIQLLIKQLGDDKPKVREDAMNELILIGKPAEPYLKNVKMGKDAEVDWRVKQILHIITERMKTPNLSTPDKAWLEFLNALKSGDEILIRKVTTEEGKTALNMWGFTERDADFLKNRVIEQWYIEGETAKATAEERPAMPGGHTSITLRKTTDGWKMDNIMRGR